MKKILLVNPYDISDKEYGPPRMGLGLAYLASVVRKNTEAEVRILDKFAEYRLNDFNAVATERLLMNAIEDFDPDIVGFTTYTETIADVIKDARKVKEISPDSIVVIGGAHATACPLETLEHYSFIDIAVIGEGENTLLDILNGKEFGDIEGIAYRDGENVKKTGPRRTSMEIDSIPYPSRDMMRMEYYSESSKVVHSRGSYNYATVLSSRGCKGACSFCLQVKVHKRFSAHSSGYVIAEIKSILDQYPQVNAIEFIDNLFLCDPGATEKLCEELINTGLNKRVKWKAQTRATNVTPEILELMKKAGCFMLGFGFESGSQDILDRMNKMTTVQDIRQAAKYTKEAGIGLEAYFIYGYPGETEKDLLETLDIIREVSPDFVGFGKFMPVPGSLDYKRTLASGKIPFRYDDLSVDWEQVNLYRENGNFNYSDISDKRFEELEKMALYEVVKPINIKYHMSDMGLSKMLSPGFILKLIKKSFIIFKNPKYFFSRMSDFVQVLTRKKS